MKTALCLLSVWLVMTLVSSSPVDPGRRLINRPTFDEFGVRVKRSGGIKDGIKRPQRLEYRLRKGEYICGDKICKLQVGVEPKGCGGICQYPVMPHYNPTKH